jgi:hypothetical protein
MWLASTQMQAVQGPERCDASTFPVAIHGARGKPINDAPFASHQAIYPRSGFGLNLILACPMLANQSRACSIGFADA